MYLGNNVLSAIFIFPESLYWVKALNTLVGILGRGKDWLLKSYQWIMSLDSVLSVMSDPNNFHLNQKGEDPIYAASILKCQLKRSWC